MECQLMKHGDVAWSIEELREECKRREIGGCAHLDKAGLIGKLKRGTGGNKSSPSPEPHPVSSSSQTIVSLQPIAQRVFDNGPTKKDGPGVIYVYFEPGGTENEWKVGTTTQSPPDRRMHDAARINGTTYNMKNSWPVYFRGFTEEIVHAELNDYSIPRKQKAGGGEWADGGKEWFKADYDVVERAIWLVRRMIDNEVVVKVEWPSSRNPESHPGSSSAETIVSLQPIAQIVFDDGPTMKDNPGAICVYFEPGGTENEWKVGTTTQNPPERRIHTTARNNGTTYKLKKSWPVCFCGFAERIVHAELNDYSIPSKKKAGGGEWADGGMELFKADYDVVERAILLVRKTIAEHYP